jgi:hypothetical protein
VAPRHGQELDADERQDREGDQDRDGYVLPQLHLRRNLPVMARAVSTIQPTATRMGGQAGDEIGSMWGTVLPWLGGPERSTSFQSAILD